MERRSHISISTLVNSFAVGCVNVTWPELPLVTNSNHMSEDIATEKFNQGKLNLSLTSSENHWSHIKEKSIVHITVKTTKQFANCMT
jgi:hypothetical protein